MNTKLITALALASGLFAVGASAQTISAAAAPAPTAAVAAVPDQIIYAPQLPSVGTLTQAAAAQGLTIKQVVQSAREVTITYQFPNEQTRTISYQLLPTYSTGAVQVVAAQTVPAPTTVTVVPAPAVVYAPAVDGYYYDPYYAGYWYPPVAVRLGFGWGWGRGWGGHGRWH